MADAVSRLDSSSIGNLPFHGLTPAEAERLYLLSEELSEVNQMIMKILRHGYEDYSPFDEDKIPNRTNLEKEMGDVGAILYLMFSAGDINPEAITVAREIKLEKIQRWLHHNQVPGQEWKEGIID